MIKTLAPIALAATAALALSAPSAAKDNDTPTAEMSKGEAKLAKLLEGRVAEKPQSCVRLFPSRNLQIIDETALVYGRGNVIYVNVPRNAEDLDDSDAILTRPSGNSLCRSDQVTTFDRHVGFYTGNIFLGDFVPYRRVDS